MPLVNNLPSFLYRDVSKKSSIPQEHYKPGDLVEYVEAPHQRDTDRQKYLGKAGVVVKQMGKEDGIHSSDNIYTVFFDGDYVMCHILDLKLITRQD